MKIIPFNEAGSHRTGTLSNVSAKDIKKILGFSANVKDDPSKVKYSWGFKADDVECGIWDYKGSHKVNSFSTYGPKNVFVELFGEGNVS